MLWIIIKTIQQVVFNCMKHIGRVCVEGKKQLKAINLQFFYNKITYTYSVTQRKQVNCNHLLLCCQIIKLTRLIYTSVSYDTLVFKEQF